MCDPLFLGFLTGAIIAVLSEVIKRHRSKTASSGQWTTQVKPVVKQAAKEEYVSIGGKQFHFRYIQQGSRFEIFAAVYPPNNSRSRSPHLTHVYSDGRISVNNQPQTLDKAKAIARYWATGYLAYLETGIFPDDGSSIEVN